MSIVTATLFAQPLAYAGPGLMDAEILEHRLRHSGLDVTSISIGATVTEVEINTAEGPLLLEYDREGRQFIAPLSLEARTAIKRLMPETELAPPRAIEMPTRLQRPVRPLINRLPDRGVNNGDEAD